MTSKARFAVYFFCCLLVIAAALAVVHNQNTHKNQAETENNQQAGQGQKQIIDDAYRLRAEQIAASMDLNTLAAQVLLASVEGRDSLHETTRAFLLQVPPGGIILYGYNMSSTLELTRNYIKELTLCIADVSVPPFIASDQEGGRVLRFQEKAALPPPLSYWEKLPEADRSFWQINFRGGEFLAAMEGIFLLIENDAAAAGRELRQSGITLNLAPVTETLTARNRNVLRDRSYGPNPAFVAGAASAFVRGMQGGGVAAALKHFPGNSADDPHKSKAVLNVSNRELEKLMGTFAETIRRENPAAVMLSHVIIPQWDTKPCSLSPHAVQQLRDMGFMGIITADDYTMAAVDVPVEVCAVEALAAGVDLIMVWPRDLVKTHQAIMEAINTGHLSESKVREAVGRVVYQKIRFELIR